MDAFWTALAARDADALARCYSEDATFKDPVFDLRDGQVRDMWRMLFSGASDLTITVVVRSDTPDGFAGTWEATYTFSGTGRLVRNRIRTTARVRDGLIVQQRDRFPFWRWARQAFGVRGLLLGWTPVMRSAVRQQAQARLIRRLATPATPSGAPATTPARQAARSRRR